MEGERVVTGSFNITVTLTDKRQIQMTGYIYNDDTHEADLRLDKYMNTLDRQVVRADVTNKEAQLAASDVQIEQAAARFAAFSELKKQGQKLSPAQMQEIKQHEANVNYIVKGKEILRAAIAEGKKKLNGVSA